MGRFVPVPVFGTSGSGLCLADQQDLQEQGGEEVAQPVSLRTRVDCVRRLVVGNI